MNNFPKSNNVEHLSSQKRNLAESIEPVEGMKKLMTFLEIAAKAMQKEGAPVKSDCRIDLEAFKNCYPAEVLSRDRQRAARIQKEWQEKSTDKERVGEKLEMLKTAIFNKFLGEEFIVARSNMIDDIDNGVDNVILERTTSNLVCAFDEVADISGPIYQEKAAKILEKNVDHSGASLKYGLGLDLKTKKFVPTALENIPIFYLALPEEYINELIKTFNRSVKSQEETKLFSYFISSLQTQIKALDLKISILPPKMRQRLEIFQQTIEKYSRAK